MYDTLTLVTVFSAFVIAGAVKGVLGLGLPTVALGLLTATIDLPTAMSLQLVPALATNFWQAATGGFGLVILVRIWPFLLTATVTIWLGSTALGFVSLSLLSMLLGALLVIYSVLSLMGVRATIKNRQEVWVGPLAGATNGLLTGMTGSSVIPGVMYLQSIGLPRDMLVQAMGFLFTVSTVSLGMALYGRNLLSVELGTLSVAALVPAAVGMVIGQRIRSVLSEIVFQRVMLVSLIILGCYIIGTAIL
ncbi:MAG: sulfite exporter TauE/SafE family protein [Albidovulum sp.]|nr:sulfite exporter TauE/SafE family protein [Albidovulum sp.]MDE0531010.1 sulfite exporter TauE/SafE family protein [Albidovulum sp.]